MPSVVDVASESVSSLEAIAALATLWHGLADDLGRLRADVRSNAHELDALRLLVDLLDHAYAAAVALHPSAEPIDRARLVELAEERVALLAALSDAWDRERFADDPAKTRPVIHFFRDDHLLLVVDDGLHELQARLAAIDESVTSEHLATIVGNA